MRPRNLKTPTAVNLYSIYKRHQKSSSPSVARLSTFYDTVYEKILAVAKVYFSPQYLFVLFNDGFISIPIEDAPLPL